MMRTKPTTRRAMVAVSDHPLSDAKAKPTTKSAPVGAKPLVTVAYALKLDLERLMTYIQS